MDAGSAAAPSPLPSQPSAAPVLPVEPLAGAEEEEEEEGRKKKKKKKKHKDKDTHREA